MTTMQIKLNAINDVYKLVDILTAFDGEVDLESGRYRVDGRSLLGIFSLDLRQPVTLLMHNEENLPLLKEKLKDYIVE